MLCPPGPPPPGVPASADSATVATPESVVEWFMSFFDPDLASPSAPAARRWRRGVVCAGEALFIPAGWWHCALNLEDTIAVTAKFASAANLLKVLKCLKTRNADLISGCPPAERASLYDRFVCALREQCPEVLREWDACEEATASARLGRNARSRVCAAGCT